ncbi:acetoacetate metabolism regulatory protein AtoC [Halovibrio variabilis]|uniref:Acetoacetate metabolism regulatory protein AtoC n=1 Tax=Halovibrio variabilis TaxID=31910 RepID=A0A511UL02_9GAMM|nr:sigma-54 dependent transcriptional regulator [Halovibrio variabilis]GEN27274.1 acetoacetate metabolism regulatory protein AtoC [Halovibrio variabilis]
MTHQEHLLPLLVVEDDAAIRELLEEELQDAGYTTLGVPSAEEAIALLSHTTVALVITDVRLPGMTGIQLLQQLRQAGSELGIIVITAFGTIDQAVEALKLGADDFLTKPLDLDAIRDSVFRVLERQRLAVFHDSDVSHFHGIVGKSQVMQTLFHDASRLAKSDAPILILGESGTGKELLARAIHQESQRGEEPFVPINCASIPADLMESEFFGHVKGAFTGANEARKGLFQSAQGGSLFLDEIGEMPINLQAKLLRALQEKTVRPVGSEREEPVDVRIIAATHRNLEQEIEQANFRSDLFYRLETFSLRIPPLRDRGSDIEHLVFALIDKHSEAQGKQIEQIEPDALSNLLNYSYPGNVRELENAVMRAVTLSEDGSLNHKDLPERLREHSSPEAGMPLAATLSGEIVAGTPIPTPPPIRWPSLEEVEKRYINKVLEATGGNKRRTAEVLGIARRTLYRRLEDNEE